MAFNGIASIIILITEATLSFSAEQFSLRERRLHFIKTTFVTIRRKQGRYINMLNIHGIPSFNEEIILSPSLDPQIKLTTTARPHLIENVLNKYLRSTFDN